jgi:type III pantothenate kinase
MGTFRPGELEVSKSWRYSTGVPRTGDELLLLIRSLLREGGHDPDTIARVVVGSVVPAHTDLLRKALARMGKGEVFVVDGDAGLPIELDVEEPRTVGADRIVNTLAASYLYARDTIVVDLGTATTFDCITGNGVFLGGVIAPGLQAGQEWLGGRTAKLPRVELRPPEQVIGRRTEACLQSGIFFSAVDGMDGIVDRIRKEWGRPDAHVVATGGFASVVAPHSRTIAQVDPFLTLVGLELAGGYMAGDRTSGLDSTP